MSTPDTLTKLFFDAVDRFSSKRAALRHKKDGSWRDITHQELARTVHHAAVGLWELGLRPGDRVAILSGNRPEWAVADYACLTARCADVAVYPTIPAAQVAYVLSDSAATAAFVADRAQYHKILEARAEAPALKHLISFDPSIEGPDVLSLQRLCQSGAAAEGRYPGYRRDACAVARDDLATLIYTSGTTGHPKGVMLSHYNIASNVGAALKVLNIGPEDSCLSFLPLSHSFERMAGHYTMFHAGATICYAESVDQVPANLLEVRPTIVLTAPRLFEKVYARVLEKAVRGGALRRAGFFWARGTAERWADMSLARRPIPSGLVWKKRLADKLVFSKLHKLTGGRIRFFVSGGAPLAPEIARFFYAAGLPVLEGYGITETSPVVSVNPLEAPRIGTVGPILPGLEARITSDGEILVRGPNVMKGYYGKPKATREVIDREGWFHTGDLGEFDSENYLKITDRKKDVFVTAGGRSIAPQPIENKVKANKYVQNAVLIGDKRKFPSILVVPNADALELWATEQGILAEPGKFFEHPEVVAKIEREVKLCLSSLASYEMPEKVLIVENDFTVESGELTPSSKVRRNVVEQHYRDRIEELYRE